MGFEENEISLKSQGGTEITKRGIGKRLPQHLLEDFQVICSRVREIEEDKVRVYWLHDLPQDPELSHLKQKSSRDRFHKTVFSSNWQLQQFVNLLEFPHDDSCCVIETPIEPFPNVVKSKDEIRLIYFSTPHRGLNLLIPVFEKLVEQHPDKNLHLDVFSSFEIYGWKDADEPYKQLFERCKNHPNITYHGFKPAEELRAALEKAHIFAYPNTWQETACRCLIESMSAGLLCVHPNYGALPDTSGGLTFMYQWDQDPNVHVNKFYQAMSHAINIVHDEGTQNYLKLGKMYADSRFNIDKITNQWEDLLTHLKDKYPTVESRAIPKEMFVYRT